MLQTQDGWNIAVAIVAHWYNVYLFSYTIMSVTQLNSKFDISCNRE